MQFILHTYTLPYSKLSGPRMILIYNRHFCKSSPIKPHDICSNVRIIPPHTPHAPVHMFECSGLCWSHRETWTRNQPHIGECRERVLAGIQCWKNATNSMRWCGNGDLPVSSFPAGEFKCLHRNSLIPLTHDVVPSEPSLITLLLNAELRESDIITILWWCALKSEFSHGCLSTNTISRRSNRAWSSSVNDNERQWWLQRPSVGRRMCILQVRKLTQKAGKGEGRGRRKCI